MSSVSATGATVFPDPLVLDTDLLDTAGMAETFALPDGEAMAFTWHALRRTFASLLSDAGAIGEMIDYLLGQQPPSTRGRHYQAPPMGELARTVALLELVLPARAGVLQSSRQSSPTFGAASGGTSKPSGGEGPDPVEAALVRALERATSEGAIVAIVQQLELRRARRERG